MKGIVLYVNYPKKLAFLSMKKKSFAFVLGRFLTKNYLHAKNIYSTIMTSMAIEKERLSLIRIRMRLCSLDVRWLSIIIQNGSTPMDVSAPLVKRLFWKTKKAAESSSTLACLVKIYRTMSVQVHIRVSIFTFLNRCIR